MIPQCIKNKQLENKVTELENNKILNKKDTRWINTYTIHYDFASVPKLIFIASGSSIMVYALYWNTLIELGGNISDSYKIDTTIDYNNKTVTFKLSDGGIMYVVDFPNI